MATDNSVTTVQAARRANLTRYYRAGAFSRVVFDATGWRSAPSQVSQYVNGHRNIGESAARKLEHALGLQYGELDT